MFAMVQTLSLCKVVHPMLNMEATCIKNAMRLLKIKMYLANQDLHVTQLYFGKKYLLCIELQNTNIQVVVVLLFLQRI